MVSYKELGLVNTRELFKNAVAGGYAIPAYNFNNMEQLQAIIQACVETKSPVILQVSSGARKYASKTLLRYMVQGAVAYAKELGVAIPIVLHLDHGDTFELCKECIDAGFSSVMIDGSHHPYDKNVELTKQVVDYAHDHDVTRGGRAGRAGRHRGRRLRRALALHPAGRGRGLRQEDRRRLARHLHRHLARRRQVQARAVHPHRRRRARPARPPLRHPGGGRAPHPRLPHRAARRLLGAGGEGRG